MVTAARRELEEETGVVDVTPLGNGVLDLDVHQIPAYRSEPGHRHFNLAYAFLASDDRLTESDEVAGVTWHPIDRVSELTTDRAVRRGVGAAAALL